LSALTQAVIDKKNDMNIHVAKGDETEMAGAADMEVEGEEGEEEKE
jgi:hypothetical protein